MLVMCSVKCRVVRNLLVSSLFMSTFGEDLGVISQAKLRFCEKNAL